MRIRTDPLPQSPDRGSIHFGNLHAELEGNSISISEGWKLQSYFSNFSSLHAHFGVLILTG